LCPNSVVMASRESSACFSLLRMLKTYMNEGIVRGSVRIKALSNTRLTTVKTKKKVLFEIAFFLCFSRIGISVSPHHIYWYTNISLSFIAKFVSNKLNHPVCDVLHISVAGSFRRKTPVCSQHVPKQTVRVDTAVYVFVVHGQLEGRS